MKDKIFGVLQRVGRSFMLPIAILPVAGLLLGLGASFTNPATIHMYHMEKVLGEGTVLNFLLTIMSKVGSAIFDNLPIIFAVGIAIGMAKKEKEVAALAAMIAFFVMHVSINGMLVLSGKILSDGKVAKGVLPGTIASVCGIQSLQMGVFGGVIVGLGVAALHNKYYKKELPNALSFFGGSRFVPIVSTITYMFVGIGMYFVWPPVQKGIYALGALVTGSGYAGTFLFGIIKRALIPFGLHHVFYMPFWQTGLGGTMTVAGKVVEGGQNIFFAQLADPTTAHFSASATRYFSGEFIFMMFGLPGAALAMYRCAKPEKKKQVGGLLLSAALTSILTGITEPIEFSFLFAAPILFGVQVVLAGSCYMLAQMLNVAVGLTFSGGLIDFLLFGVLQGNAKTSWMKVIPCGIVYFFLYYFAFTWLIKKKDLKTPGREDTEGDAKLYTKADYKNKKASAGATDEKSTLITAGLGGKENVSDLDCCATRLRVTVLDTDKVSENLLKQSGARAVIIKGKGVQVVYGPQVAVIKSNLESFFETAASDNVLLDVAEEAVAGEEAAEKPEETKESGSEILLGAYMDGTAMTLEDVDDGVFSAHVLGDGVAIEPDKGELYAPADGEISMVFDTKHAIGMTSGNAEILLHMGIDTVQLNGEHFDVCVSAGDTVKKGDLLAKFDMEKIRAAGYRLVTPMIVTNTDDFAEVKVEKTGKVTIRENLLTLH